MRFKAKGIDAGTSVTAALVVVGEIRDNAVNLAIDDVSGQVGLTMVTSKGTAPASVKLCTTISPGRLFEPATIPETSWSTTMPAVLSMVLKAFLTFSWR